MKKRRAGSTQFYLFCHAKRRRLFIGVFDSLECLMQDLMSVSLPSTITRNSGKQNVFETSKKNRFEISPIFSFVYWFIHFYRNHTPNSQFFTMTCSKYSTRPPSTWARKTSKRFLDHWHIDIKFMLGCDLELTSPDDGAAGPVAVGPSMAAL
jgi:hypothetical protein